jgi:hypothetical protein
MDSPCILASAVPTLNFDRHFILQESDGRNRCKTLTVIMFSLSNCINCNDYHEYNNFERFKHFDSSINF